MNTRYNLSPQGLTLIELMIVILIIGIFSSLVMIHGVNSSSFKETSAFAKELQSRIQIAREQSLSQIMTLGLRINRNNYQFYQFNKNEKTWTALDSQDNFWKPDVIPSSLTLHVIVHKSVGSSGPTGEVSPFPQIIFSPDGSFTEFTIVIQTQSSHRVLQLVGHSGGLIVVQEKS